LFFKRVNAKLAPMFAKARVRRKLGQKANWPNRSKLVSPFDGIALSQSVMRGIFNVSCRSLAHKAWK